MSNDKLWFLSDKVKPHIPDSPSERFPCFETEKVKIIEINGRTYISVQEGENYNRREIRGGVFQIEWSVAVKDGELFEVPELSTHDAESFGSVSINAPNEILKKLGFAEKKIELPEPIIQLPIPEWVSLETNWTGDWPNCGMCVRFCFVSEAEQMCIKFKKELEEKLKI